MPKFQENSNLCAKSAESVTIECGEQRPMRNEGVKKAVRIGLYDVEKTVGRGNYAVVKLARHRVTKSEVMETQSMLYLVLEYAPNNEMFDFIAKNGRMNEIEARKKFGQVVLAVEYCHSQNIIHRDLKAENLLLDLDMNIKIADFGFSNFCKKSESLVTFCGSPPYAAPEVFEGKKYAGAEIDVWSLGVVLYVMICAAFPFDGPTLQILRDRVLSGRFRIPYFMSNTCENLLRKMLVVDPARRCAIQQIRRHQWLTTGAASETAEIVGDGCTSRNDSREGRSTDVTNDRQRDEWRPLGNLGCCPIYYNASEQILKLMQSLGIDSNKTRDSIKRDARDNFHAIFLLLLDKWKMQSRDQQFGGLPQRRVSSDASVHMGVFQQRSPRPTLRSSNRRPDSSFVLLQSSATPNPLANSLLLLHQQNRQNKEKQKLEIEANFDQQPQQILQQKLQLQLQHKQQQAHQHQRQNLPTVADSPTLSYGPSVSTDSSSGADSEVFGLQKTGTSGRFSWARGDNFQTSSCSSGGGEWSPNISGESSRCSSCSGGALNPSTRSSLSCALPTPSFDASPSPSVASLLMSDFSDYCNSSPSPEPVGNLFHCQQWSVGMDPLAQCQKMYNQRPQSSCNALYQSCDGSSPEEQRQIFGAPPLHPTELFASTNHGDCTLLQLRASDNAVFSTANQGRPQQLEKMGRNGQLFPNRLVGQEKTRAVTDLNAQFHKNTMTANNQWELMDAVSNSNAHFYKNDETTNDQSVSKAEISMTAGRRSIDHGRTTCGKFAHHCNEKPPLPKRISLPDDFGNKPKKLLTCLQMLRINNHMLTTSSREHPPTTGWNSAHPTTHPPADQCSESLDGRDFIDISLPGADLLQFHGFRSNTPIVGLCANVNEIKKSPEYLIVDKWTSKFSRTVVDQSEPVDQKSVEKIDSASSTEIFDSTLKNDEFSTNLDLPSVTTQKLRLSSPQYASRRSHYQILQNRHCRSKHLHRQSTCLPHGNPALQRQLCGDLGETGYSNPAFSTLCNFPTVGNLCATGKFERFTPNDFANRTDSTDSNTSNNLELVQEEAMDIL